MSSYVLNSFVIHLLSDLDIVALTRTQQETGQEKKMLILSIIKVLSIIYTTEVQFVIVGYVKTSITFRSAKVITPFGLSSELLWSAS